MDQRWITKPSAILSHRIFIADVYTSIADVSPCVWDIFGLGVHRRMFADCSALFGDISPMMFGVETSGENFNSCIEIFLDVPMPWRLFAYVADHSPNHGCMVALPWRCPNVCIGRLKKPRGNVALWGRREGDVAQWLERLTASPVMHAFRVRSPLFPCGVFREAALFLPSQCD